MEFIERLNNLLADNEWTKMDLSKKADIPYTTICGWFNNRLPDYNAIIKLSKFFNVTTDYILGCDNNNTESQKLSQQYTADEQALLTVYRTMSQGKKQALFNMLDINTETLKSKEER